MGVCDITLVSWAYIIKKDKLMVGIVIPHYGDDKILETCTASLSQLPGIRVRVIDNNTKNRGFTAAVNIGIKDFLENVEYIWILNNDTKFLVYKA